MTIKFKKILEKAVQPVRTNGAGYNLVATDITTDIIPNRGQVNLVYRTGLGIEIPEGYVGILYSPSDIYKTTLRMCSGQILSGNIDDEVIVRYMNTIDVVPAAYSVGDVIAKLVIVKAEDVEFEELIDMTEHSATEGEQGLPENEGEPTNPENTEAVSGGEENIPEQAQ
jgi:dUTPase